MTNTVSERLTNEVLSCAIQIESGGRPAIKAATSSATGLGQFITKTWRDTVKAHRPDVYNKYGPDKVLNLRTNPSFSIEMLARLWEDSLNILGSGATPGDLYLAHFLGVGAARKVMRAEASDPVEPVVGPAAVQANKSILVGKSCGQVRAWASRKMAAAGGHDWVAKWYDPNDPLVARSEAASAEEIEDNVVAHKVEEPDDEPDDGLAPADVTPHGKVNDQIANLQKALVEMGYNGVGVIDGAWGGETKGAIAAFLNDRGRDDLRANMSQPVLDEIAHARLENFKKPISEERAKITPKELAKYNPTMLSTLRTKLAAAWGLAGTALVSVYTALASYFHTLWDAIAPVRKALDTVPGFVWVLLAGLVCVLLYFNAHRAEEDTKEAFQNRRLLR